MTAITDESDFDETVRLRQDRAQLFAVCNAAASVIAGLGAAALGSALAQVLTT